MVATFQTTGVYAAMDDGERERRFSACVANVSDRFISNSGPVVHQAIRILSGISLILAIAARPGVHAQGANASILGSELPPALLLSSSRYW